MTPPTASYDVFDTVVTRSFAHPRDLFVQLGVELRARGLVALDAVDFARARWESELAARRQSPWEEVLHTDIYRVLAGRLGWDAATAGQARQAELDLESRHLHGVPWIRAGLAAARARAGRLLFLTDMYLPADVLGGWLRREGVMQDGDQLFVSGEQRANKNSGKLFAIVRDATGADYTTWHHAGDHPNADVAMPRRLGMSSTHLPQAQPTARERAVRGPGGEFARPWRSLVAGSMRLARLERAGSSTREDLLWQTGATVAGPLFYAFVRWVLAEAERRGLRRLYFLARDGQVFHRVAQAIQAAGGPAVECRYLVVSRQLFAGLAEQDSPAALRTLLAPVGSFQSVANALALLNLDAAWAAAHLPERFRALDPAADLSPGHRTALADWLLEPAQQPAIAAALAARARLARAYLAAAGLRAGEPVGVVDAGWYGSIQRSLEHVLGSDGRPAPLTGFYLGLMAAAAGRFAGEGIGFTNRFGPLPLQREESHKVLLELMAQADHGQACALEEQGGTVTARCQDPGPVDLAGIRLFQDAILAFVRRQLAVESVAPPPPDELADVAIANYRALHDRPDAAEASVLGFLPHSDQYVESRHAGLCATMTLAEVLAALRDFRRRPPHWWLQGQAALGHGAPLRAFLGAKALWWRLRGRDA